ncbi:DUF3526 domain-containing protein [Spirosoma montaniterrae]|uniref:ABC transporter permease n=1 Tax=Spirosoma montaniterrae TaxID=1178516 RepID=A0A1P9WXT9_9BACT|nr:DUF3526 domain-containing protein [Spirosoma montaniterrae]AQG80194.1 hypothetical protein AWR27_13225 [Spirosoma montaniterrae]
MLNLVQKEMADYGQDRRVRWIGLTLYALFAVALASGYTTYVSTNRTHTDAADASYRQWLAQGTKNPHGAAHYGFYVYKPLSPLSVLDRGLENYLGQAVWLEAHNQNEVKQRDANDAGNLARFGSLTVGFVWQFLVPLAIVLLGFNLFTKEREGGTLRLLFSAGVAPRYILWGKAVALYRVVLALVAPMLVLAGMAVWLAGGTDAFFDILPNLGLMLAIYLVYFALWTGVALLVSARASGSGIALVTLLGLWAFGTFVVPRLGSSLAKTVYPAPSSFAFSHNVRLDNELGIDRKTPVSLRRKRLDDSLLTRYGVDTITKLPIGYQGVLLQEGEEYGELIYAHNYGALHETYARQDALMDLINGLSPALAMQSLSAGLAGTNLPKQLHFAKQAEQHRQLIAQTMNRDIIQHGAGQAAYQVGPALWKAVPPFRYEPPPFRFVLQQLVLSLAALSVWIFVVAFLLNQTAYRIRLDL